MQRVTWEFLQRTTSATNNERILQRATSYFLQGTTSATSNERILQPATSYFLQQATSATSNEQILQRVMSNKWIVTPPFFMKFWHKEHFSDKSFNKWLGKNMSLQKKWSFPLSVSSVNVTKSAVSFGFGHIYWRNP